MPEGQTSGFIPEGLSAWPSQALAEDSQEAFFQAIRERRASAARDAEAVRRMGKAGWYSGAAVGLIGVLAALTVYLKSPLPPPPGYILVDRTTGAMDPPVAAVDAPRVFSDIVRERALRDLIINCESYIPQSFARFDYHACMVMATPAEQQRLEAEIGAKGTRFPPNVFGANGWAMPVGFQKFTDKGDIGSGVNKLFHYEVRYERAEIVNGGKEQRVRYTAIVDFSFHPELRISAPDRLINPAGIQVVAYSTTPD